MTRLHRPALTSALLTYTLAGLIGVAAAIIVMTIPAIQGIGPGWNPPGGDQAQSLTGHLAFQADGWRWPLLTAGNLFWPRGISIALTDSNPAMSLLAKIATKATGHPPINLLGWFLAGCWVLQPVAAAYAARGLGLGTVPALAAALLSIAWPALMIRMGHINLCAHFLILLALGLTFRRIERGGGWVAPALVMIAATVTQPYLFQLDAIVFAAIPLHAILSRRTGWRMDCFGYLAIGFAAVGLLMLLSGPLGGGDKGFVFFSMNLLSPIWPQMSGVFGADLPIIDATGGQYEGFNWLGAGVLLLLSVAVARSLLSWEWPLRFRALSIILGCLALFSLSSHVYVGQIRVLNLGTKPWEDIFGTFRTPGRAFWPVGYAIMLASVAGVARLPRSFATPLLLAAVALQFIDIRPLWAGAHGTWETGTGIKTPVVPAGTSLFTVVPFPGCTPDASIKWEGPIMLLDAMRHSARVGDIGIGRSPRWFTCEGFLSDTIELPLAVGETRAYFGSVTQASLRVAALGSGAVCRHVDDAVLCGRGVAPFGGTPVAQGVALQSVTLPLTLTGRDLTPVFGSSWRIDPSGEAWSEGPQGTLLLSVPTGGNLLMTLHLIGIANTAGGTREVWMRVGEDAPRPFSLPDGQEIDVALPIEAASVESGVLRIALTVVRPLDPAKRGMTAPVQRAAIRMLSLRLEQR